MENNKITFEQMPEAVYQLRCDLNEVKQLLLKQPAQSAPTEPDELLTREEAAEYLKVSLVTLWSWSKKGWLNPRRIGNEVRYLRSELLASTIPKKRNGM